MAIGAALVATAALLLGFVFFVVASAIAVVVGVVLWFRLRAIQRQASTDHGDRASDIIEGDYEVVTRPGQDDKLP